MKIPELEQALDSFDANQRHQVLAELNRAHAATPPAGMNVNMHFHSFFSYNACGYSPSRIAWAAHREGLYAAALCDFDVLDGQAEFLAAGRLLGLRVAVHLETRAYLREFSDREITSPGEPGVTYIMGAGFARTFPSDSPQASGLRSYREQADQRNRDLVSRINPCVPAIAVDYQRDVVTLSPGNSPTERHIIRAYVRQAEVSFPARDRRIQFWSATLKKPEADVGKLIDNVPLFDEKVRAAFAKKGGFGYLQPTATTFPPVDDFVKWVLSCGAIPMMTWLDGTSAGEEQPGPMLECMKSKGVTATNIIPDRNWNYADPAVRARKHAKLTDFVVAADAMALPINIGTEMNKDGLPFVDDLACEALRPFKEVFLRGARVMVGQSILGCYADFAYSGTAAQAEFGPDGKARNAFFAAVGALPPLQEAVASELQQGGPARALNAIRDSVRKGRWTV